MCQIDELGFSLYLRRRGHLYMYSTFDLPCHLGRAQLNQYEPVGSNRNMAYSPQCSLGARTPVVPPEMVQSVFYSIQRLNRMRESLALLRSSSHQKEAGFRLT